MLEIFQTEDHMMGDKWKQIKGEAKQDAKMLGAIEVKG